MKIGAILGRKQARGCFSLVIIKQICMLRFLCLRRKCKLGAYQEHLSYQLRIRNIAPIFGAAKDSEAGLPVPPINFPDPKSLKTRLLTDPLFKEKQTKIGLYDSLSRTPSLETRASGRFHNIVNDYKPHNIQFYISVKQIFVYATSFRYC